MKKQFFELWNERVLKNFLMNFIKVIVINFLITLDKTQLTGEILLVPVCNPLGVNQRSHYFSSGRYNLYDGKDWNRIFWDYEKTGADISQFAQDNQDLEQDEIQAKYRQTILNQFYQLIRHIR